MSIDRRNLIASSAVLAGAATLPSEDAQAAPSPTVRPPLARKQDEEIMQQIERSMALLDRSRGYLLSASEGADPDLRHRAAFTLKASLRGVEMMIHMAGISVRDRYPPTAEEFKGILKAGGLKIG